MDKRIKEIRKDLGLTQEEFAQKLGVSSVTISKYENGVTQPTAQKMALIEGLLNNKNNAVTTQKNTIETVPLAQAQFKPVIPSDLYERLDCDIDEYMKTNISNMRSSATIKQFAPFSYFFEVIGDAMAPYFLPSDMLALKIQPHPFTVENGRVYVIDTRGGVIVRMLYRNGENFLAKAFNPRFTELPIPSSDVYDIYKVVGLVRRNI